MCESYDLGDSRGGLLGDVGILRGYKWDLETATILL